MYKQLRRTLPKNKPKNYQVLIAERLAVQGFDVSAEKVRNVLRGLNKNIELTIAVHRELKKVLKQHERNLAKLKRISGAK